MKEAVIVSTARTPIGKAYRGAFNYTKPPTMAGHAIREAVKRAGIEPGEVEEVLLGMHLSDEGRAALVEFEETTKFDRFPGGIERDLADIMRLLPHVQEDLGQ